MFHSRLSLEQLSLFRCSCIWTLAALKVDTGGKNVCLDSSTVDYHSLDTEGANSRRSMSVMAAFEPA